LATATAAGAGAAAARAEAPAGLELVAVDFLGVVGVGVAGHGRDQLVRRMALAVDLLVHDPVDGDDELGRLVELDVEGEALAGAPAILDVLMGSGAKCWRSSNPVHVDANGVSGPPASGPDRCAHSCTTFYSGIEVTGLYKIVNGTLTHISGPPQHGRNSKPSPRALKAT
jgi:hypothetical protein